MSCLPSVSGEELVYLASTLAIAIAKGLDASTINTLSNFFNVIGDSLGVIAAQRTACTQNDPENI